MLVRQHVDQLDHRLVFLRGILDLHSLHETVVQVKREQRDRQRAEVCLEHRRHTADVVEPVRVAQVKCEIIAPFEQLCYSFRLAGSTRLAVDALVIQR